MRATVFLTAVMQGMFFDGGITFAENPATQTADSVAASRSLRIGAVAYAPSAVTIFQSVTRYLDANGLSSDFVLYSGYDELVAALERGDVDVAWNTPLAHAKYYVASDGACRTLVMRDVDFGVRSVLVAREDSGVRTIHDLTGKRLVLGSSQAAEATVLPLYYLKRSGLDLDQVIVVSLEREVDNQGNPCASPAHVLKAIKSGRGDAGIVTEESCREFGDAQAGSAAASDAGLVRVWTSPPFSHCVFTASTTLDTGRADRFTELMTRMRSDDPSTADVLRLEGAKRWLRGAPDGFVDLIEALRRPEPVK